MPRYIDEEQLWTRLRSICDLNCPYSEKQRDVMCGACLLGDAFETIDSEKTVDAESVVRCKDCKFYLGDGLDECELMEAKSIIASLNSKRWYSDFFCAWGERREDGETN